MTKKLTVFKGPIANTKPAKQCTADQLVMAVRDGSMVGLGDWRDAVASVREANQKEDREERKATLPYTTPNGAFRKRGLDGLIEFSDVLFLDIDNVGTSNDLYAAKASIASNAFVLGVWLSASGSGLHALVKVAGRRSNEDNHAAYRAAQELLHEDIDPSCKDASRATYLSHDPDAYHNPAAEPMPWTMPKTQQELAGEVFDKPTYEQWLAWTSGRAGYFEASGELKGPCPSCGGKDRFHVRKDGLFGCRKCEAGGEILKAAFPAVFCDPERYSPPLDLGDGPPPEERQEPEMAVSPQTLFAKHFLTDDFKFDPVRGRWARWKNGSWNLDADFDALRRMERVGTRLAQDWKDSARNRFCALNQFQAALKLASVQPGVAVHSAGDEGVAFDANLDLLGLPEGGVLDRGFVRRAQRDDLVTLRMGAAPAKGTPRKWLDFLHEAFAGFEHETDEAVEAFRTWIRGALVGEGSAKDESFVFAQGRAGTGKSTLVETVRHVFGQYCAQVSGSRLAGDGGHRQWMLRVAGKRLVTVTELPDEVRGHSSAWNSELLNALVSGETIEANYMRQNSVEFTPRARLLVAGNERPITSNPGVFRRMKLYTMHNKPVRVRTSLKHDLREEAGLILQWMLDGKSGVPRWPERISEDVGNYEEDADPLSAFFEDCVTVREGLRTSKRALYERYTQWIDANGGRLWSQTAFSRKVATNHRDGRSNGVRLWVGIGLNEKWSPPIRHHWSD